MKILNDIQQKLKAPKGQTNAFGKYKYRSCEDILEAVKPLLGDATLVLNDEIVQVGDRYYVKATATLRHEKEMESCTAFAREEFDKKGMDQSQITGASSSYARKYALNGLFLIDDTKDSDVTNEGEKEAPKTAPKAPASPAVPQKVATQAVSFQSLLAEAGKLETQMRVELFKKKVNDLVKNKEIKMTVDQSNELKQAIADVSESFQPTSDEMSQEEANSFVDSL